MPFKIFFLISLCFVCHLVTAQTHFIGHVLDLYSHQAIDNAEISINENTKLTQCNSSGEFQLKMPNTFLHKKITIRKSGYFDRNITIQNLKDDTFYITKKEYTHLLQLPTKESFDKIQSTPFNQIYGDVSSIKFVYSVNDKKIYYANSSKYLIHYHFVKDVLNYSKEPSLFTSENYTKNSNREYILGYLNYFKSSDKYVLDFHLGNGADCADINLIYNTIIKTSFFGNKLFLYVTNDNQVSCDIPKITDIELYKGQNYQPLNPVDYCGYLRKIDISNIEKVDIGRHDIVVVNGIPQDISVVAGIITTEFQTPLSHINVLSHNRKTPNMALKNVWTHSLINQLENKLVYLRVTLDSFELREASINEAALFWKNREPHKEHKLYKDTISNGLIVLENVNYKGVSVIGGKAANYAELMKIKSSSGKIPLPENSFAIPFYYYEQHIKKSGLDSYISKMVNDTLFLTNRVYKNKVLSVLRDSILKLPVDTQLIGLIKKYIFSQNLTANLRFRSSTNAEDIEGFNGAGLYDSYTGKLNSKEKSIENAIRKVWASLWNERAFDERAYFKINQHSISMGILVHRSFPSEVANGVVVTKNLYNKYNAGLVINVQVGEMSVVKSEDSYLPDQIIYYAYGPKIYICHSTVPEMKGKTVMTDAELDELRTYCDAIQDHYNAIYHSHKVMDIEFKVDIVNNRRKIYIKQARIY